MQQARRDAGSRSCGFRVQANRSCRIVLSENPTQTGPGVKSAEQIGADLESVLDDGENLRILSIVGRGSVQSVADILYLKGVDLGIVRSDTLDYLEKKGFANNIKGQFTYITKLYNEEVHVVAPNVVVAAALAPVYVVALYGLPVGVAVAAVALVAPAWVPAAFLARAAAQALVRRSAR